MTLLSLVLCSHYLCQFIPKHTNIVAGRFVAMFLEHCRFLSACSVRLSAWPHLCCWEFVWSPSIEYIGCLWIKVEGYCWASRKVIENPIFATVKTRIEVEWSPNYSSLCMPMIVWVPALLWCLLHFVYFFIISFAMKQACIKSIKSAWVAFVCLAFPRTSALSTMLVV